MHSLILVLIILAIILIVFFFLLLFYLVYLSIKVSKLIDKIEFVIDDIIIKLENLNPSIESLKKLFNYIDAFDLIFKSNLKSGLSLLRRNSFVLFKLLKIFQDLLLKKESKKSIFSEIFKRKKAKLNKKDDKQVSKKREKLIKKLDKSKKILTNSQFEHLKKLDFATTSGFIGKIISSVTGKNATQGKKQKIVKNRSKKREKKMVTAKK